uniref:Plasmodium yoelii subtelomeric region (PYST-C1) n=1 Tax=Strongyloides venezuelensis TaxID=75913 RepID=A0A0K0EZV5_STRVS
MNFYSYRLLFIFIFLAIFFNKYQAFKNKEASEDGLFEKLKPNGKSYSSKNIGKGISMFSLMTRHDDNNDEGTRRACLKKNKAKTIKCKKSNALASKFNKKITTIIVKKITTKNAMKVTKTKQSYY